MIRIKDEDFARLPGLTLPVNLKTLYGALVEKDKTIQDLQDYLCLTPDHPLVFTDRLVGTKYLDDAKDFLDVSPEELIDWDQVESMFPYILIER